MPKVFITGYLSDTQRNTLYQNAALFVSPSLCEGFGITPIEAALFGVPVITTRETSIPEATQNFFITMNRPPMTPDCLKKYWMSFKKSRIPIGCARSKRPFERLIRH
ncbi:MAG TPA: glycosyltransferase [Thermotogota bacterium]|nr:glycosyltransferase [Thermotogota bacterium]